MKKLSVLITLIISTFLLTSIAQANSKAKPAYKEGQYGLLHDQQAAFPLPLQKYEDKNTPDGKMDLWETLKYRAFQQNGFNIVATIIFLLAITHTFMAGYFIEMAHKHEKRQEKINAERGTTADAKPQVDAKDDVSFRAYLFHFLGEVEVIFGIWVIALVAAIFYFFGFHIKGFNLDGLVEGFHQTTKYLGHDVNFTEPLFVVIIMAISATRPVVKFAESIVGKVARLLGGGTAAWWFAVLTITPLLGSFITEPAAMTIAAMLLAKWFYKRNPPTAFAYATLGLLFVNVSVGGTLTHFAAPPVLMIADKWNFNMGFMFMNFGWKAITGILIANSLYFVLFFKYFSKMKETIKEGTQKLYWQEREDPVPTWITVAHLVFLAWTVLTAHYPALFIGGFMFFIGFTQATGHHQNDVSMKSPLLVGFFLAGLVIHGGCQGWWIEPLLTTFQDNSLVLMLGATVLTGFNDNAAITFLASQAPNLAIGAKYAVLAGAVTGGGLTVIANAPNPAGQSILGKFFQGGVAPLKLLMAALLPTIIMGCSFMLLPSDGMTHDPAHHEVSTAAQSEKTCPVCGQTLHDTNHGKHNQNH